jgi:protein YibB
MNSTIVTAFYDTGREEWHDFGKPFSRKTSVYIERFLRLLFLKNDIIVFAESNFIDILKKLTKNKSNILFVELNLFDICSEELKLISAIQKSDEFINKLNPKVKDSPEYWNEKYVLVTNSKPFFLRKALEYTAADYLTWVDFGYCRSFRSIPRDGNWLPFSNGKVTLMFLKQYDGKSVEDCILNNDVYISGELIIASRENVLAFADLCLSVIEKFRANCIVDDDQGIFLGAYLEKPEIFEIQMVPDWQIDPDADVFSSLIRTNYPVQDHIGLLMRLFLEIKNKFHLLYQNRF